MNQLAQLLPGVKPEICDIWMRHGEIRKYRRGDVLSLSDSAVQRLGILLSGVVRMVFIDEYNRSCISNYFYSPGMILMGSAYAPGNCRGEAVSDTTLLEIDTTCFSGLPVPDGQATSDMLSRYDMLLNQHLNIEMVLRNHKAEERYQWFLENYPGVAYVESGRNIADFLGVTPETLSRVIAKRRRQGVETE